MASSTNRMMWIARTGTGLGVLGLLLTFIPWVCTIAPFLSQAAIVMGLMAFVDGQKNDDNNNKILGIVGLIVGLIGLIIFSIIYISGWRLF